MAASAVGLHRQPFGGGPSGSTEGRPAERCHGRAASALPVLRRRYSGLMEPQMLAQEFRVSLQTCGPFPVKLQSAP